VTIAPEAVGWTEPIPAGKVLAICACGTTRAVFEKKLRAGQSTSCGCINAERLTRVNTTDTTALAPDHSDEVTPGARFGRWVVLGDVQPGHNLKAPCRCNCGTERLVVAAFLLNRTSRSCGCLKRDHQRSAT